MPAFLQLLMPAPPQFFGLCALLAVVVAFVALGAIVGGPRRRPEADIVFGWATASTLFSVAGVAGLTALTTVAIALGIVAVACGLAAVRRDRRFTAGGAIRVLLLASPLVALAASMTPTQWDEMTQWLPNARYLFEHDSFPRPDLPKSPSVFPAYPYGLPLVTFLSSRLAGFLVENAASIFNLLLYLAFGLFIARLVAMAAATDRSASPTAERLGAIRISWGLCAFAGLLVTAFNPTFVTRLVFSAYADAPTAIAIGFSGAFTWMMLNALADDDDASARSFAWQSGLAIAAALSLKQANLIHLIGLVAASGLIALRDPTIRWQNLLRLAPQMLVLPLLSYGLWRLYVGLNISGGEFSFRALSEWIIASTPDILGRMALIASKKSGYFGVMLIAMAFALRAVRRPRTAFDRLAVLTAVCFVVYNGFLLLTYIAAFGEDEGLRAASYWRYNTHLGGICLLFAAYGAALLYGKFVTRPLPGLVGGLAIVLVLALPFAMGKKLRFDSHPRYGYASATASEIAKRLSQQDRLLLVDRGDDGQYLVIMRYRMHGSAPIVGEISAWTSATGEAVRRSADSTRASHVWIYESAPDIDAAFGVRLAPKASHLLARRAEGWTAVASWPYPDRTGK